jgi:hypothetical protein
VNLTAFMVGAGIKRLKFSTPFEITVDGEQLRIDEIELRDDVTPAPPVFDELTSPDDIETKPEGICAAPGCGQKNGWRFAKDYCRAHGLGLAGVTGAR